MADCTEPCKDREEFLSGSSSLNYLAITVKPDISCINGILRSYSMETNNLAWRAMIKTIAYLKGSNLKRKYKYKEFGRDFHIDCYVDASHKSPHEKNSGKNLHKSRDAYFVFLNGCLIAWNSKRILLSCQSTDEAEVIGANNGWKAALWVRKYLKELGFGVD